jgi:hypothetical protein
MCCTTQKAAQQVFSASIVAAPAEIHFVQSPDCLGTPITLPDLMAGLVKIAPSRNLSAVSANKCCVSTLCTSERRVCPAPYQFERAAANGSKSKFASKAVGLLWADCVEKLFLDRNSLC